MFDLSFVYLEKEIDTRRAFATSYPPYCVRPGFNTMFIKMPNQFHHANLYDALHFK